MDVIAHRDRAVGARPGSPHVILPWILAAAVAAPLGILLHELGHFAVAHALRFPDVALHYGAVSDGAAEAGFPPWQQGVQSLAGPLVTLALVLACCFAARRHGPRPWIVAPAFAVGVRSAGIGIAFLVVRVRQPVVGGNFDELNAARHLGVSPDWLIGASLLLIAAAWGMLIRWIPRGRRVVALAGTATGAAVGVQFYVGWLGPRVLP